MVQDIKQQNKNKKCEKCILRSDYVITITVQTARLVALSL